MDSGVIAAYVYEKNQDSNESDDLVAVISSKIQSGEFRIVDLVANLGEFLTRDDNNVRGKALLLLSCVLERLPSDYLTAKHVYVLFQFYLNRLDDEFVLKENMRGLGAILKMNQLPIQQIPTFLEHISTQIDMPKYSQSTRHAVLTTLKIFLTVHMDSLVKAGPSFCYPKFVKLFQGEKDPRNIMLCFEMIKLLIQNLDVTPYAEEIFNISYCYFPITFRAPANDPQFPITTEQLKHSLRDVLVSTSLFSPFLLPLLFEKLKASAARVKLDTLDILYHAFCFWPIESFSNETKNYWVSVKHDIWEETDTNVKNEALKVLNKLALRMSESSALVEQNRQWLSLIIDENLQNITKDFDNKAGISFGASFAAISSNNPAVFEFSFDKVVKFLEDNCKAEESLPKKQTLLSFCSYLVDSALKVYGRRKQVKSVEISPLFLQSKNLLLVFAYASLEGVSKDQVQLRTLALRCVHKIACIRGYMNDEEVAMVARILRDIAFDKDEPLSKDAVEKIADLAKYKPTIISEVCFPTAFSQLELSANQSSEGFSHAFHVLEQISTETFLFNSLVVRTTALIEDQLRNETENSKLVDLALQTLLRTLRRKLKENSTDAYLHGKDLLSWIFKQAQSYALNEARLHVSSLLTMSRMVNELVRVFSHDDQEEFFQQVWNLYLPVHPESQRTSALKVYFDDKAKQFRPFQIESNQKLHDTLPLFCAAYTALRPTVSYIRTLDVELVSLFIKLVYNDNSNIVKMFLLRSICSAINKADSVDAFLNSPDYVSCYKNFETGTNADQSLDIVAFVIKGLVGRNYTQAIASLKQYVKILESDRFIRLLPNEILYICKDDFYLSKENHFVQKLLFKQKLYNAIMPSLMTSLQDASEQRKPAYLMALANVIGNVPNEIVMSDLSNLFPLLLQSLSLDNPAVKYYALNVILASITELPELVAEHIETLIDLLLKAACDLNNLFIVRLTALKSLGSITEQIPAPKLQPLRNRVQRELVKALDDPKRDVRAAACSARHKWFS
ncbi:TFIIH regulator [Schizosaccharomyces japonicus yFS275]|uniref:MMS19 nucleotide excision repair protein n=1 Tax=Schizosaccharomyces japonicus (strain yFS275 / FY16936) TaxID=402676 RepID=B6K1E0_SCHJY|nr:TFIIH regulator [Schizosaccharomyces japonicus yFS275]EEB07761.1 TFIIH regulator [Schizosaccharomyces japonicus yFS275]